MIALPPFGGADVQSSLSWLTCAVAVGADIVAGTVVAVTVVAEDAAEVPAAFVAVTVIEYCVADARPWTTIGDDEPVAVLVVCPAAVAVTVKEVAAGDRAGKENDTVAAPSLYALLVPTSVALTLIGASGSKKSLDA